MASTGFEAVGGPERTTHGKENYDDKEYKLDETPSTYGVRDDEANPAYDSTEKLVQDSTHRKLKPRHIQLIGIGGYVVTLSNCQVTSLRLNGLQYHRYGTVCSNWPRTAPWWTCLPIHGLYYLVSFVHPLWRQQFWRKKRKSRRIEEQEAFKECERVKSEIDSRKSMRSLLAR